MNKLKDDGVLKRCAPSSHVCPAEAAATDSRACRESRPWGCERGGDGWNMEKRKAEFCQLCESRVCVCVCVQATDGASGDRNKETLFSLTNGGASVKDRRASPAALTCMFGQKEKAPCEEM